MIALNGTTRIIQAQRERHQYNESNSGTTRNINTTREIINTDYDNIIPKNQQVTTL